MQLHPHNPLPTQFEGALAKVRLVADGKMTACAISGPTGIGKTHQVELLLRAMGIPFHHLAGSRQALLKAAWEFRDGQTVMIMDDADSFFIGDDVDMNLMKALADPAPEREIVYENDRTINGRAPYPARFKTRVRLINLTNLNPNAPTFRGAKLEHYKAVTSRVIPSVLTHDPWWVLDWILYLVTTEDILQRILWRKPLRCAQEIVDFVCANAYNIRLSIRDIQHMARLRAAIDDHHDWRIAVESFLLQPAECIANPPPYPRAPRIIPPRERMEPGFVWQESVIIPPDLTPTPAAPAPRSVQVATPTPPQRPAPVLGFGGGPMPMGFMTSRR